MVMEKPFSAVLLAPAEEVAAAHVFCQTAGKGGAPDPGGAPWRGAILFAAVGVPFLCIFALPLDWLFGTPDRRIITHPSATPVLLLNPRDDLYVLCD